MKIYLTACLTPATTLTNEQTITDNTLN